MLLVSPANGVNSFWHKLQHQIEIQLIRFLALKE